LTREAVALYFRKLAPEGILAVHLSNRYLALSQVIAASADDLGLVAMHRVSVTREGEREKGLFGSGWAAVALSPVPLDPLPATWLPLARQAGFRTWTDDYSNVLG